MYREKFILGKKTEYSLARILNTTALASKDEDVKEHWDLEAEILEILYKIDVKGLKRQNVYDPTATEYFHWVEFENVLGGKGSGWLYGKADLFAFETYDYWLLVDKKILQEFIEIKCAGKTVGSRKNPYDLYQRKGRKDVITKVKTIDLMRISKFIIEKPEDERTNHQE